MTVEPTLPPMTGAEMRCTLDYLGLTTNWLARKLSVDPRRLKRISIGQESMNEAIARAVDDVYEETADTVEQLAIQYRLKVADTDGDVVFPVYRSEIEYERVYKDARFPVQWHRCVAVRVIEQVPGLQLEYAEPYRHSTPPWERGDRHRQRAAVE